MPPADPQALLPEYRIGVLDTLSIRVFKEPDLSFEQIAVNAGGAIDFPLVGRVPAVGKTPGELAADLQAELGTRFIRSPQVIVGVVKSAGQTFTVDGNVIEPGSYEINGRASLVQAIARAHGLTRTAVVDQIVVLRIVDGQRMGAVFDLQAIREGKAPDPQILPGDTIVVGFSALKGVYRDIISAAPLFNVFRVF